MAGTAFARGAAGRPGRARPARDGHADEADASARARRSRSRSRRPTSSAGRSRPSCRWPWSTGRCCGSSATACRRSARSSTTRRGPGRSRPSRPTRSATRPATVPVPEAVVEEAERRPRPAPPTGRPTRLAEAGEGRGCRRRSPAPAAGARRWRRRRRRDAGRDGRRCGGMTGGGTGGRPCRGRGRRRRWRLRERVGDARSAERRPTPRTSSRRLRVATRTDGRARARGRRRRLAARWPDGAGEPAGRPRERFVETAYWNPGVVTGKDGKATRHLPRPDGPLGVPLHRPGRHRGRHPRRPDDGRPGRPQGLLRRPEGARRADPGRQAPVLGPGPSRRASPGTVDAAADGLRRGPRAGLSPGRSSSRPTASRRSCFEPFEVPDGDDVRLTLTAAVGRGDGRADGRGADPPLGRAGVRLGLGHGQRRRDGLRRPAAGPGVREPRDARRRLADRCGGCWSSWPWGEDAYPLERAAADLLPVPPEHHGRPRRRPARGGLGPGLPPRRPGRRGRPRPPG